MRSSSSGNGLQPTLTRIVVAQNGRLKANFSDNSMVLLNSKGNAFIFCSADGQTTRQLCEYALSRHSTLVAMALEFRNMHLDVPFFCSQVLRPARNVFNLGYLIAEVWWPSSLADAQARGLLEELPDGKKAVSTVDGSARAVLHFHGQRIAICYPLLVQARLQEVQYEYVWHTQAFSVLNYPSRWQPAVQLLLEASFSNRPSEDACQVLDQHKCAIEQPLPSQLEQSMVRTGTSTSSRSVLPLVDQQQCSASLLNTEFPIGSWWFEPTLSLLPNDEFITLEWTPDATYHMLPSCGEVEVWVHKDESCLRSEKQGHFVAHFKGQQQQQLYAANCIPEYVWSQDSSERYQLSHIAAHALKLRQHMLSNQSINKAQSTAGSSSHLFASRQDAPSSLEETFAVVSSAVTETSTVPGHGSFTAYADGRVRVQFEDRTIIHVNRSHTHCKAVLGDGKGLVVACSNPVGLEQYLPMVMDFARWAFKTPGERGLEKRRQMQVQAELHASSRMRYICDYSAHKRVPAELAQPDLQVTRLEDIPAIGKQTEGLDEGFSRDRHHVIESMLLRNAELLQRLG